MMDKSSFFEVGKICKRYWKEYRYDIRERDESMITQKWISIIYSNDIHTNKYVFFCGNDNHMIFDFRLIYMSAKDNTVGRIWFPLVSIS